MLYRLAVRFLLGLHTFGGTCSKNNFKLKKNVYTLRLAMKGEYSHVSVTEHTSYSTGQPCHMAG